MKTLTWPPPQSADAAVAGIIEARRQPRHRRRPPTRIEELVLWSAALEGDQRAANALAAAYHRMIHKLARQFGRGLEYEEVVSVGMVGFARALQKFDPRRGRLSTVSVWWIRRDIQIARRRSPLVRPPPALFDEVARVANGRAPNPKMNPANVRAARDAMRATRSLDAPLFGVTDEDGTSWTLGELLPDPCAVDPEAALALKQESRAAATVGARPFPCAGPANPAG